LAALQFGTKRVPEPRDKFVIITVPCYSEGDQSLRETINSIASLRYENTRKLLLVICDGQVVGAGNDKTTPSIVLDILGASTAADVDAAEPLLYQAIGEGAKQLSYAKVYSGLYEYEGQVLPYLVVVKVGKPSERVRPGNRGKRDSQVLLLRFLNRVQSVLS
jgi:chitin synthase